MTSIFDVNFDKTNNRGALSVITPETISNPVELNYKTIPCMTELYSKIISGNSIYGL